MLRPRLLVTAAQHYADRMRGRPRHLDEVSSEEDALEAARQSGNRDYDVRRHVAVLGEYISAHKRNTDARDDRPGDPGHPA